jgi:hypothetical protein
LIPVDYVVYALSKGLERAQKNQIYNITSCNNISSITIMEQLKKTVSFENIQFVSEPFEDFSSFEKRLKNTLSPIEPYLNNHIHFINENTLTLLEKEKDFVLQAHTLDEILMKQREVTNQDSQKSYTIEQKEQEHLPFLKKAEEKN